MSKERLEDIKNRYMELEYDFNLRKEDIDWLIEQAKEKEFYEVQSERKTEALEEIISLLQDDYFENWEEALEVAERNKNDFVRMEKLKDDLRIRKTKELLIEQNQRYREALEFYASDEAWGLFDHHGRNQINMDGGKLARQALESDNE